MKGVPRCKTVRHKPSVLCLNPSDACWMRCDLGMQGTRLQSGTKPREKVHFFFSLLFSSFMFFLHKPWTSCRGGTESPNLGFFFFFFFNWFKKQFFELQFILKKTGPKWHRFSLFLFKTSTSQNTEFWPNKSF